MLLLQREEHRLNQCPRSEYRSTSQANSIQAMFWICPFGCFMVPFIIHSLCLHPIFWIVISADSMPTLDSNKKRAAWWHIKSASMNPQSQIHSFVQPFGAFRFVMGWYPDFYHPFLIGFSSVNHPASLGISHLNPFEETCI